MKRILYLSMLLIVALLSSCDDKETDDISRITYYPLLEMAGEELVILEKGEEFVDPGVGASINGEAIDVLVEGTVNTGEAGIYLLIYSAENEDGFSAKITRQVIIQDLSSIAGNDFSGEYKRTYYGGPKNGGFSQWVAAAQPGVYKVNDVGGVDDPDYEYDLTVYNVKENLFVMPIQENFLGGTIFASSSKSGSRPDLIEMTEIGYKWSVKGSGYGTNLRTFEKQ